MKFIHIADVHLGAEPEGLKLGSKSRGQEIWESLERIIKICEWEEVDLLLIAGDLFHRQPLKKELKELNYLFSRLTRTKVVFIAGNHDFIKHDSYYLTFRWNENVYPLLNGHMGSVEFKELKTSVYGLSYYQREITERIYDRAKAPGRQKYEILLAHGGDEKHIPIKKEILSNLGYSYIAMGHIHKPQTLVENQIAYAGALEPIDKNDTGKHGYIRGEATEKGVKAEFVPSAKREYMHLPVEVGKNMTNGFAREKIREMIQINGIENIYKFILTGFRDADITFEPESLKGYGNVIEIVDETKPSYDFDKLLEENKGNLLGRYIESLRECEDGSVAHMALYEGVQALLDTKRS